MWSGETRCSQPPSLASPCTVMTLEPMPSIAAPMRISMRARHWTCGSEAALRMIVVPAVSAAAMSAFSVPITDGSSMKKSHASRPPSGAVRRMSRSCSTCAPSARKASRCGSSRRRPITSPPGGGSRAEPKRASSGPPTSTLARIRSARSASTSVVVTRVRLQGDHTGAAVLDLHAQRLEQPDQRVGVADPRHVVEDDLLVGEQGCGEERQGRVLVSGGHDAAGQRHPAFDDELLHRGIERRADAGPARKLG